MTLAKADKYGEEPIDVESIGYTSVETLLGRLEADRAIQNQAPSTKMGQGLRYPAN